MTILSAKTKICLVIGDPVAHSLSPLMHNAALEALGLAGEFVYAAAHVPPEQLKDAVAGMRAFGLRGMSVTIPHKETIGTYLDRVDEQAAAIGAVNTVVNTDGVLRGCNTDAAGVVGPLERRTALAGKTVAVIGAGGAARAAVFALIAKGASVRIFNRSVDRGKELAEAAECEFRPLEMVAQVEECDIVINASSVGMTPHEDESPIPKQYLHASQIVMDIVYTPYETRLLRESRASGAGVIYGTEMFVAQGAAQFQLYTGVEAPWDVMEQVLKSHFGVA